MCARLNSILCFVLLSCLAAERVMPSAKPPHIPPALYTQEQAVAGDSAYQLHCASCHGPSLDGQKGGYPAPALRGREFGDPEVGLKVSDVFRVIGKRMPASAPGSLAPQSQVEILAFLLNENGFPPGTIKLTYQMASISPVPFVFYSR